MATATSEIQGLHQASAYPEIWIVEAPAGAPRRRLLENRLRRAEGDGARAFSVCCDFNSGGPWAGVSGLFAALFDEMQARRPDLVSRHALELVCVLPRLRRSLVVRNPSLTDLAPPEEKTRNYPADRAYRVVQGLIDLLDDFKKTIAADATWAIAGDSYDHVGDIGRRFFSELMRRRGEQLRLQLFLSVDPGQAAQAQASLKTGATLEVCALELDTRPAASPAGMDAAAASQRASDLEERAGDDRIEMQLHLPELIRYWESAGRMEKVVRYRSFGLEIYNTLGLYADALRYGDGLLQLAREHEPNDIDLQWRIVHKLLTSHVGLLDVQSSLEIAEGEGFRVTRNDPGRRAYLFYYISMLYARYRKPRDLAQGEHYLERHLQAVEEAGFPENKYHFQVVLNHNALAMIRNFQGRFQEAIDLCRNGIARLNAHLDPAEHRLYRSVLLYNIAQVCFATGCHQEALEHYAAAIAMDPNYSEYFNDRGNVLLHMGRLEEAHADYLRAVELSPPYFEVFANLGQCCRRQGSMREAIEWYSRALDLEPNHLLAWLGRAKAREDLGEGEQAIHDYTSALDRDPGQWEAVASRGVLYYEKGDLESSLADLTRAIDLKRDQSDLYQNRSVVLSDLGRRQEAADDIAAALALHPSSEDCAMLQSRLGDLKGAMPSGIGAIPPA